MTVGFFTVVADMILPNKVKGPFPLPTIAKRSKIWLVFMHLVNKQSR